MKSSTRTSSAPKWNSRWLDLLSRLVEAYVKHQKQKLSASLEKATEAQTGSLLEQVKQLDALLKSVTGGL